MKSTERGKIVFISNIFSEVIGTILQGSPSTQIIFDRHPNKPLKLDQLIVEMQRKCKKIEKGKVPFKMKLILKSQKDNEGFITAIYL